MVKDNRIVFIRGYETDEEILEKFKDEVFRLGLQDSLSKTKFNELYDKDRCPSPTALLNRFDCTWEELVSKIGLEYDGLKEICEGVSRANKGKKHALTWSGMKREEVLDVVVNELRKKNIWTVTEYKDKRDRKTTPSVPMVNKIIGSWKEVKSEYDRRYGGVSQ